MTTRVNLAEVVPLRAFDGNGDPVSGAKLRVFEAGTTTAVSLTSDLAGTTAVAQPVVSDSEGYFVSTDSLDALYIVPQAIKYTIENSADVELVSQDNLMATPNLSEFGTEAGSIWAKTADSNLIYKLKGASAFKTAFQVDDPNSVVRVAMDADADSYIVSDTDDVIKAIIAGTERFQVNATGIKINSGITITGVASQAEAEAGTATDKVMTPLRVDQHLDARADTPDFTSAAQTFVAATSTALAHGLGAEPSRTQVIYECITADRNYSIGDRVEFGGSDIHVANSNTFGHIIRKDATNVTIAYASNGLALPNASTGVSQTLTAASWEIYVEAWK